MVLILEKGSIQIIIKGVKGDVVTKEGETIIDDNICEFLYHILIIMMKKGFHFIQSQSIQSI